MFSSYHIQLNKNCTAKAVPEIAANVDGEFVIDQVTGCLLFSLHYWLCRDSLFPFPLLDLRSQCHAAETGLRVFRTRDAPALCDLLALGGA